MVRGFLFSAPTGSDLSPPFHPTGSDLGAPFSIKYHATRATLAILGSEIGKISSLHKASSKTIGNVPKQATTAMVRGAAIAIGPEKLAEEAAVNTLDLLDDYSIIVLWFLLVLAARLDFRKAYKLVQAGAVWKVLSGGENIEEAMQELKNPQGESLVDYFTSMSLQMLASQRLRDEDGKGAGEMSDLGCHSHIDEPPKGIAEDREDERYSGPFSGALYKEFFYHCLGIASTAVGTTFFTTDTGYIGRAKHAIELGDALCVLQGSNYPVVLRPCEDGTYRLITWTYTHDVFEDSETAFDLTGCEKRWFELS
ncbi:hypothetical protein EPUS_05351 [Endocarpon pusillum Z07020]|uniref:Uncharacterized protein n=1 Tax=Endocarpon pusillum (strain Z07020 / HMAS-L-300199) TaxID=1263415 RepID=U1GNQ0_ENDPU|nr:uncharacterized protein EPUS_05351 [Endocarpon pusillum Z07020]ERF73928.1 hypothetical protein EPUS_05351 [Endocarpon pusillum Z07020]